MGLAIPLLVIEHKLTEKFKTEFTELNDNLDKLTRMVIAENYDTIKNEIKSWNENDVYDTLILLLVDQFGISADKINLETNIVDDFGID